MRAYGKIETAIWQSPKFRAVSERGQRLFFYVVACPHGNAVGCFVLPIGYATADLGWDVKTVSETITETVSKGLIERDERTGLTWIRGWWGHNTIENPNVAKAAARSVLSLPHKSPVYSAFIADLDAHKEQFKPSVWEAFRNGLPNPIETKEPEPEPEPEPKPEPEPDGAQTAPPPASPAPTLPVIPDPLKTDDELADEAPAALVAKRGSRLPIDWMPSADDIAFCRTQRPDLDPGAVADEFRDYWIAKAGQAGVKLDWSATWRNWVRRQHAAKRANGQSRTMQALDDLERRFAS
jgi:hypothetical protein